MCEPMYLNVYQADDGTQFLGASAYSDKNNSDIAAWTTRFRRLYRLIVTLKHPE